MPSYAVVINHVEQRLQQAVVSVPVGFGAVETINVIAKDIVLSSVLVDHVQSLVELLRGDSGGRRGAVNVRLWLSLNGRCSGYVLGLLHDGGLSVERCLQKTQQGNGRGEGGGGLFLGVFLWV